MDEVLKSYAATTIVDAKSLKTDLSRVQERGWAVGNAEFEDFINCVAARIRDARSRVMAAVSITALKATANLDELR